MFNYHISSGNPEGTDWTLDMKHVTEFTKEEFQDIAEAAIVYALEKGYKECGVAFVSSTDVEQDNKIFG